MPTSSRENAPWSLDHIIRSNAQTILDVGAGKGTYASELRAIGYDGHITASEIWPAYVELFALRDLYDAVYVEDVRQRNTFNYDLVIMGDVLEHMTKDDATNVWGKVRTQAHHALIAIPIVHYPQGEEYGNPFEAHVKDDWTHEEVLDTFPGITAHVIGQWTGAYWADFR
jgi:2-polyprenyl-3-methyl-5-hydroxy-6-metoxy-1,4-benzoquinol methylase